MWITSLNGGPRDFCRDLRRAAVRTLLGNTRDCPSPEGSDPEEISESIQLCVLFRRVDLPGDCAESVGEASSALGSTPHRIEAGLVGKWISLMRLLIAENVRMRK